MDLSGLTTKTQRVVKGKLNQKTAVIRETTTEGDLKKEIETVKQKLTDLQNKHKLLKKDNKKFDEVKKFLKGKNHEDEDVIGVIQLYMNKVEELEGLKQENRNTINNLQKNLETEKKKSLTSKNKLVSQSRNNMELEQKYEDVTELFELFNNLVIEYVKESNSILDGLNKM